jgi:hypothetical protein
MSLMVSMQQNPIRKICQMRAAASSWPACLIGLKKGATARDEPGRPREFSPG